MGIFSCRRTHKVDGTKENCTEIDMRLIRNEINIRAEHFGCVATIGNFDGVHLGHMDLIDRLGRLATQYRMPTTVILFEPQPAEFFLKDGLPNRLTRLREKIRLLESCGIDQLLVLKFDDRLAAYSAVEFVDKILIGKLGVKALVVGDDFRFGKGRDGDYSLLSELAESRKFSLERAPAFSVEGERVSSTLVRDRLRDGDIGGAERILGHSYFIEGRVAQGHKRGREWGFPTANINLEKFRTPLSGIFAARVLGLARKKLRAVAYIGSRPIIDDPRFVLEVHLFDFNTDCYGKLIRVEFVERIRDDMNFESFERMAEQIEKDCLAAKRILKND